MASSSSTTTGSSYNNNPPPVPFDRCFYNPTPSECECLDKKKMIQRVSWTPANPLRRFTICPNRGTDLDEKCSLYRFNDPTLSDFQKSMVSQLKDKVASLVDQVSRLEAQATLMQDLLQQKDMIIANLQSIIAEKPKEEKKKVKKKPKEEKKDMISCFPISLVVFSLGVLLIAWWLKLNGSPSL